MHWLEERLRHRGGVGIAENRLPPKFFKGMTIFSPLVFVSAWAWGRKMPGRSSLPQKHARR